MTNPLAMVERVVDTRHVLAKAGESPRVRRVRTPRSGQIGTFSRSCNFSAFLLPALPTFNWLSNTAAGGEKLWSTEFYNVQLP